MGGNGHDGSRMDKKLGAVRRRKFAAQLAVALPEFGWSVTEASMMPLMLKLRVPEELLTVCWLCSPVIGLMLHPVLGHFSDRYGRSPFVLIFGAVSAFGLMSLPIIVSSLHGPAAIATVLTVFGFVDTSHDLLLTPTRAAMNDVFEAESSECRCAMLGGCAKVFALLLVVIFGGNLAFTIAGVLVLVACVPQLFVPWGAPTAASTDEDDVSGQAASPARQRTGEEAAEQSLTQRWQRSFPAGFLMMWIVTCTGWVAVCVVSFGTTSAFAEHDGAPPESDEFEQGVRLCSGILIFCNLVFTLMGGALPFMVRACGGHFNMLVTTLGVFVAAMLAFAPTLPKWAMVFSMVALVPASYQSVQNVPYAWLEAQPDFDAQERGRLTGWINSSLAVGQMLTALVSGPIVAWAGGKVFSSFVMGAGLCAVMVVAVLVQSALKPRGQSGAGKASATPALAAEAAAVAPAETEMAGAQASRPNFVSA